MKVTLDLPDELLRQAQVCAAEGGCSLQTFVIEALTEKLRSIASEARSDEKDGRRALAARLKLQPDGAYVNLDGIEDEAFFRNLEKIRSRR